MIKCRFGCNKDTEYDTQKYKPISDVYVTNYIIDANTDINTDEFKSENMIYLVDNTVLNLTFGSSSNTNHKVIMKLYYDYSPIDFKLKDPKDYVSEYVIELQEDSKITLPVILDSESLKSDHNIHKLVVTFTTGYEQNASSFDMVTNVYGLNAIYDIVHTIDYDNNVYNPYEYESILPDNNYDKEYSDITFNFDYENETQNPECISYMKNFFCI